MNPLRFVPSLTWWRHYRRDWRRPDLTAGLTAGAVVIPKAMAYATIAGLPLQVGLYTAVVPMGVYALFGTSRPLSVSTTTTLAILTATALGKIVAGADTGSLIAAAATLALLVGVLLVAASVLRLGFVANFISEPVLTGFKSGIGLVIIADQLPKLLGVHIEKTGFLRDLVFITQQFPHTSIVTLLLAILLLVLIFGLERFAPRWPAPLLVIGFAIVASWLLGLSEAGVATVGTIPSGLPMLVLPRWDWAESLWPAAAGIALMSFTETVAAARAFGVPGEPRPEPNQELLALGLANTAGGLFGAMPAGGGTTQTAVNRKAGARTQVAALVTAALAVAALLWLAPLLALMPQVALAAVVVAYSLDLIKPAEFAEIRRVRRVEFYWALMAFAGVVLLGTLKGILIAVITSLLALAQQTYNPPVYLLGRKRGTQVFRAHSTAHPDDETWPGLLLVRTEGRLFFANAPQLAEKMRALMEPAKPSVVVLDLSGVFDIEYSALKRMVEAEQTLREQGVEVWLAALNAEPLEVVRRSTLGEALGKERLFFTVQDAVERYLQRGASGT